MTSESFTKTEILTLRASFERIWPHSDEPRSHHALLQQFYGKFFLQCPEAEALFSGIEMRTQRRMLFTALKSVIANLENHAQMEGYLDGLSDRHAGYGVPADHYPIFVECLIDCMRKADSSHWNPESEKQWRRAFHVICSRMASRAL